MELLTFQHFYIRGHVINYHKIGIWIIYPFYLKTLQGGFELHSVKALRIVIISTFTMYLLFSIIVISVLHQPWCSCSLTDRVTLFKQLDNEIVALLRTDPFGVGLPAYEKGETYKRELQNFNVELSKHNLDLALEAKRLYDVGPPQLIKEKIDREKLRQSYNWSPYIYYSMLTLVKEIGKAWEDFVTGYSWYQKQEPVKANSYSSYHNFQQKRATI